MKKLTVGLMALGAVAMMGTTAMAGELKATSFNQEVEFEHDNSSPATAVNFTTSIGLKYEDWSFGVQGGKFWKHDKSDKERRITSTTGRLQLSANKKVADGLSLGYKFRGQNNMDRHYVNYSYSNGMFMSSADLFYTRNNGRHSDVLTLEIFPVGVKVGPVTAKLFAAFDKNIDQVAYSSYNDKGELQLKRESGHEYQVRLYAPIYSEGPFSVNSELRITLDQNQKNKKFKDGEKPEYRHYKSFGRTRAVLKFGYKLSDSANVYANFAYEFRSFKYENGFDKKDNPKGDKNYKNIAVGWNYKF